MSIRIRLLGVWVLALASTAAAQLGETTLVSISSSGQQAQAGAWRTAVSPDGRYVAFETHSTDLDPVATTIVNRVYLHDRVTGQLALVSVTPAGLSSSKNALLASVSAGGLFVAFLADGDDLAPGDDNGLSDVVVRDLAAGTTSLVSVSSDGVQANGASGDSSISADGRWVAFESAADNLVPGDTNGKSDVFLRDTLTGSTVRVSVASDGSQANDHSSNPALSLDGQHVAFESRATNLATGADNGAMDVYVHDLATGATERVSLPLGGGALTLSAENPALSADGRIVSFESYAADFVAGDTNATKDVFVRDRLSGATTRASVSSSGAQGNDLSGMIDPSSGADEHSLSADGRFVVFRSEASNLVPQDTNVRDDIFVHDRLTSLTTRVSLNSLFGQANGHSAQPSISADGRWISFESNSSNLVSDDTTPSNQGTDAFLRDRGPWNDLGSALAGIKGKPALLALGSLEADTSVSLLLRLAAPSAPALLLVSMHGTPVPFKGGTLQAFPPLLTALATTNANGEVLIVSTWPTGVPAATDLHFQWAIADVAAVHGVALSQALEAVTP